MNVQHSIHIPSFLKVYDNALDDLGSILQNQGINISISYYKGLSKYNLIFSRYKKFYNKLTFTK